MIKVNINNNTLTADISNNSAGLTFRLVGLLLVFMACLQALPAAWQELLRFDRGQIADGQVWRLLTGPYIHLGWGHLALNGVGLALGTWVFAAERAPMQWFHATLLSTISVGLGLWWLSPGVTWCVGLSGVLHGLMLVGALSWILRGEQAGWWMTGLWILKLAWENLRGELPWSGTLAGGPVVTDAHLWGAAGGVLYVLLSAIWAIWRRGKRRV